MKTVLITGCSKGIGYETAKQLLNKGYFVIGISRSSAHIDNDNYVEFLQDLAKLADTKKLILEIQKKYHIDILINNAGVAYYGPFETISTEKIHEMVTVNLEVPMLITSLLIRDLRKTNGTVVNISSHTAKSSNNTYGVTYGATKSGLTSFGESLFFENRKHNVRIINIHPDMTDTALYRNADFTVDTSGGASLSPNDVAMQIVNALELPEGVVVNDITVLPQYHKILRKVTKND